jgi:hypothetical protein
MKDLATFIKAAALVPDARFVIVGSGDEAYAQQMRDLATALGVSVTWMPAQSDMPSVYATFDCLVNSSAFGEGFSNVIGEAMACGVPCIASDVGDSAWIINNPAQIFPAGDHEALAKCMRDFKPSETRSAHRRGVQHRETHRTHEPSARQKSLWITTGLGSGGAEMMLAQLVNGLPQFQHVVVSLTSGGKHAASLPEVHSLDMPAGRPTLSALWRLFKIVHQTQARRAHGLDVSRLPRRHACALHASQTRPHDLEHPPEPLRPETRKTRLRARHSCSCQALVAATTHHLQLTAQREAARGHRLLRNRRLSSSQTALISRSGSP